MQPKHGNSSAQLGNRNAVKAAPRQMLSVRLPADLIAALNALDNKTAAIEAALRAWLARHHG